MKGEHKMKIKYLSMETIEDASCLFNAYREFYKQESDLEGAREFLKDRIQKQQSTIMLAYINSSAVGFVQLYPTFSSIAMKKAYILNDLYVAKKARRSGVAQALIDECYNFCQSQGAAYITLETSTDNITAQSLYKKMGLENDPSTLHFTKHL